MAEPSPDNLRIFNTEGAVKYRVPANAAADIRSLKQHLARLCGVPRFRLRLLPVGSGRELQDGDMLESAEFQLVMLPFAEQLQEPQELELGDAIESGDIEKVEQLLQLPRNPDDILRSDDIFKSRRTTPVFLACWFGHEEIVRLLLEEAGASCLLPRHGHDGYEAGGDIVVCTPLGAACARGHVTIVEVLLRAGAPLDSTCGDIRYYDGNEHLWPFDMAMECQQQEVARFLQEEHRRRGAHGPLGCKHELP